MRNTEIKEKSFNKNDVNRDFINSDIGKVFWRVEYYGALTQCEIHEIKDNNDAVIKLAMMTDLRNETYSLLGELKYFGSSTYGSEVLKSEEFYFDIEEAKKASLARYEKECSPNGSYKVARYFDDIFECYVSDVLNKKDAKLKADEMNSGPRAYVSYQIKSV